MTVVLAIDPGKTTGYAEATIVGNRCEVSIYQEVFSPYLLYTFLEDVRPNHIVYEDFSYRNNARTGLDLTPVKLIGVIELYASQPYQGVQAYKQQPSEGKRFFTNEKLTEHGLYCRGKEHGRDATRHLLHWLEFKAGTQLYEGKLEYKLVK